MNIPSQRQISSLSLVVLLALCIHNAYPESIAVDAFEKGLFFLHSQEPDKAISEFNKVIAQDPNDSHAYYNRALAYTLKGSLSRAVADYQKARQLDPKNTLAYWGEGVVFAKESRWDKAISNYDLALGLNPDYAQLYYNRGLAYAKQGSLENALSEFNKALEIAPDYGAAYHNRAVTYSRMGDLAQANIDFSKAKEFGQTPLRSSAHIKTQLHRPVDIVLSKAKGSDARDLKATEKDLSGQSSGKNYFNRGIIYSRAASAVTEETPRPINTPGVETPVPEIQKDIVKPLSPAAITTNTREAEAYCNRGVICGQNGNLTESIDNFNKAIELDPKMALAYYNRGVAYFMTKDYDKAWIDVHMAEFLGFEIDTKFLTHLKQASGREK